MSRRPLCFLANNLLIIKSLKKRAKGTPQRKHTFPSTFNQFEFNNRNNLVALKVQKNIQFSSTTINLLKSAKELVSRLFYFL